MVIWALRQRLMARRIVEEFNEKFKSELLFQQPSSITGYDYANAYARMIAGGTKKSLSEKIKGYFTEPTDRPNEGWTLTHGFFIQMGGFIVYDGRKPYKVLTWERMLQSINAKEIDVPFIPETDILDKSKGDFLTKLFVVTQTTWFVFECFARWYMGLSLAELEVLTLAFAALNAAIYGIWWSKPQNAGYAIRIPLKRPHVDISRISQADTTLDHLDPPKRERIYSEITQDDVSVANAIEKAEPNAEGLVDKEQSWITKKFWTDHYNISRGRVRRIFCTTFRIFAYQGFFFLIEMFFRPLRKLGVNTGRPITNRPSDAPPKAEDEVGQTRVPMFYAEDGREYNVTAVVLAILISVVFGALHLVLWSSQFNTTIDQWLWRACSLYVTLEPLFLLIGLPAVLPGAPHWLNILGHVGYFVAATLYGSARLVLFCLAIYTLFHLPEGVYGDIDWVDLIKARVF